MAREEKMVKQLCNLEIIYILDHRDDMKKKKENSKAVLLDGVVQLRDCMYHLLDHRDDMRKKMVKQLCNLEIIYTLDHCDDTKKRKR